MGMLIVSDDEFTDALNNCSTDSFIKESSDEKKAEILEISSPGRRNGDIEVPSSIRAIIGETSVIDGRKDAIELAQRFGISKQSVSAYSHGVTSPANYDKPNEQITSHIQRSKDRISNKARAILFKSLRNITSEKLINAKPEVLAGVAKDMSTIIKNNEPPELNDKKSGGPQFVVYAPQYSKEDKFETITVVE